MGPSQAGPPSNRVERRRFLKFLFGMTAVSTLSMVVVPVIGFLLPQRTSGGGQGGRTLAGTTDEILPGRGKVIAFGSKPVIVLNGDQGVKAFSAVCTHLGCIVGYDARLSPDIVSPCHNGHFSATNGTVLAGPPPSPLAEYAVAVEQEQVFVMGLKA